MASGQRGVRLYIVRVMGEVEAQIAHNKTETFRAVSRTAGSSMYSKMMVGTKHTPGKPSRFLFHLFFEQVHENVTCVLSLPRPPQFEHALAEILRLLRPCATAAGLGASVMALEETVRNKL